MDLFFHLFANLLPLYGLIALGFIGGKFFNIQRDSLANLCIFILMPIVAFGFVAQIELRPEYLLLPVINYIIHVLIALPIWQAGKAVYGDKRANLLAVCSAMGNTGYFGLPVVLLLFGPDLAAVYILMMLGGNIFEATIGYYIMARGAFDVRQSLIKLAKFPNIYAIALAVLFNVQGGVLPDLFLQYWTYIKGAYIVLGMMIVGAALSTLTKFELGPRFLGLVFAGKFVLWPGLALLFIALDQSVFGLFEADIHQLLLVLSLVPPAANIAAFAAQFNVEPEKAATTLLLSTVFALFYIPAALWLIGF